VVVGDDQSAGPTKTNSHQWFSYPSHLLVVHLFGWRRKGSEEEERKGPDGPRYVK
jgi:hypothetical protein